MGAVLSRALLLSSSVSRLYMSLDLVSSSWWSGTVAVGLADRGPGSCGESCCTDDAPHPIANRDQEYRDQESRSKAL